MSTATQHTVEIDGLEIAYREAGTGPAILLLHGWPTWSYLWRELIPPLAAVIAWWRRTCPASGIEQAGRAALLLRASSSARSSPSSPSWSSTTVGLAPTTSAARWRCTWALAPAGAGRAPRAPQHTPLPGLLRRPSPTSWPASLDPEARRGCEPQRARGVPAARNEADPPPSTTTPSRPTSPPSRRRPRRATGLARGGGRVHPRGFEEIESGLGPSRACPSASGSTARRTGSCPTWGTPSPGSGM